MFSRLWHVPRLPVQSAELRPYARSLGRQIRRFSLAVVTNLVRHREAILDRQLVQEPIAQAAMELYASLCVLSRRGAELVADHGDATPAAWESAAAVLFLKQSARRVRESLRHLHDHDNAAIVHTATRVLGSE